MVPNGWKRVPIKEICDSIIDCVNKTAPVVDYQTPYKMIRTTNVRNGRVNTTDVRYVTEETYLQWIRRGAPEKGDIILTREAPVGEVGILEDAHGIFLGQRIMMYRAAKNKADNYYLFYSLSSQLCQKQIEDFSNGGTVAHMRVPDCGEILVNLPPLPEQKKIAEILSTWDQAITATEQLLANSQQQKKALMQQLVTGKKRLLDENGVVFSGEWNSICLASLVYRPLCYGVLKPGENVSNGHPLIRIQDLNDRGIVDQKTLIRITDDLHKEFRRTILNTGDLIISIVGTLGKVFVIPEELAGANITRAFAVIGANPKLINPSFLQQYLTSSKIHEWLINTATGNAQKVLNISAIKDLEIHLPTMDEQLKIANVLCAADQEIENMQKKLACLKQEKKALMQQLLTGKRRVKVGGLGWI